MPPHALGSGTISFGLVSIPIKLYTAAGSAAVSFNLLHAKCKSRLKQQYICTKDEEIVPRDQMVKGYEFSKDQYVSFTDEELKAMAQEAERAIELRCGKASLRLSSDGRIELRGTTVVSHATGLNRIRGASIKLN